PPRAPLASWRRHDRVQDNTMRPLRLFAPALALTLVATGCGSGAGGSESETDTQGVTDDTVLIGTHQPLTGPASPGFRNVSTGARAIFDYINENGGIHGRRIDYQVQDDSFRSEERRVGKECRNRGSAAHEKRKLDVKSDGRDPG